jgi:hypothetical protein
LERRETNIFRARIGLRKSLYLFKSRRSQQHGPSFFGVHMKSTSSLWFFSARLHERF